MELREAALMLAIWGVMILLIPVIILSILLFPLFWNHLDKINEFFMEV